MRSRRHDSGPKVWVAPSNWPTPPMGWSPPADWMPDEAWGPVPEGWEFWQDPLGEEPPAVDAPSTELVPTPVSGPVPQNDAPQLGFKAEKAFAKAAEPLTGMLDDGEEIRAAFRWNKVSPSVDLMVTTDRHLLGWGHAWDGPTITIRVHGADIVGHDLSGMMMKCKVTKRDGEVVAVGSLSNEKDRALFNAAMERLVESAADMSPTDLESFRLNEEQVAAVDEGFPAKHAGRLPKIVSHLDQAQQAADVGDIVEEERHIQSAIVLAGASGPLAGIKAKKWVESRVHSLVLLGNLRRGVDYVGAVGRKTTIMSDRVLHDGATYVLDADVSASVEVDGQILQSSRPTMSRMAIGSILPGSALLVGMALPKTKTDDRRRAFFRITHPKWHISERLDPDGAPELRGIAAQVNAIAASRARRDATPRPQGPASPAAPALSVAPEETEALAAAPEPTALPSRASLTAHSDSSSLNDQLEQLERIAALERDGALTPEQATALRAQVLSL